VKAVNLIPADARKQRSGNAAANAVRLPTYVLLGLLGAALALVTVYVLTGNKISDRKAQLSSLQAQVSQAQAEASRLGDYGKFVQIAHTRLQTVAGIAATRFDWHEALSDLSQVVPANTSLATLSGTVAPGANTGGGSGGSSVLRSAVTAPALELTGCTKNQDDVARLMSRLRLVEDVTRVSLGTSQKTGSTTAGPSSGAVGCGANTPNFDIVVFFKVVPGAGPNGATSITGVTTTTKPGGAS
jgi:Tfp pilus assembly protein PilN